ncbi:penicillin-binding protein 2 [Fannyhessea vaginae]|uniref:Penicillin-binding protein 2 n=1 Tax=Fannyhessea vaginae DSM 15829 TaxID=525256 RepID=F1T5E7_9ACTN|nr:penicillin-binding protein 2 [Fannyhessea vaginae]EGF23878.1 penicillin-binding protein 2 [Fannyhessea vaginae DSM 15829]QPR42184.1 penicillin-binding protein 2 [Fannyhessea vaginae]SSZ02223.1 Penicillin-binding protein 2 [Fannyhessea vaginae]
MNFVVILIVLLTVLICALMAVFLLKVKSSRRFTLDIGGGTPRASGGSENSPSSHFKSRINATGIFAGTVIGALFMRLWNMQVILSSSYTEQAEKNRTRSISTHAARGRILDRNGAVLVGNRPSLVVLAEQSVLEDEAELHILAALIGIPKAVLRLKIEDSSQGLQRGRVIAVDVSRRVVSFINAHPSLFDGVSIEARSQRSYPLGSLAGQVLGYTGVITSEQLKASQDNQDEGKITYEPGDVVGQSGIEASYENVLQGIKGEQVVFVDADGNIVNHSSSVEAQSGSDVVLTLDADIQKAAEDSLSSTIKRLQEHGKPDCFGGCAIAMDVTNGEIIAMASAPSFSPNVFVGGISSDDWDMLSSKSSHNPLLNRGIGGQYPSASTIKPLSALAALNEGIATPQSSYMCTGYWTGFGAAFGQYCWLHTGHGPMTLQTGITHSCDVVFYEVGKGFFYSSNKDGLQQMFKKWGLGSKSQIDLPGELQGRIPDEAWKREYFASYPDDAKAWQGGDNTNLAIGQGDLLVTPLQMLCVYAGIANRGSIPQPHLMKSIKSTSNSGSIIDYKCSTRISVDEKDEYMDLIQRGLYGVIYEESQAQASHFTNMKEKVAGKTGTAETSHETPTGWFIAYAPYDKPRYVVASVLENSGFGSDGAMYVVRDILGALYHEPDTSTMVDTTGAY